MAQRKRKKRRARKKAQNPKKRAIRRKKRKNPTAVRARASNPKRRRAKRRVRRASAANPRCSARRRKKRKNPARAAVANPRRGRKARSKRRKKKNPDLPVWAKAGVAAVVAVAGYTLVSVLSYVGTQRTDPTLATLERNKYILGGLTVIGGLVLAQKSALYGAAIAAAGAVYLFGAKASVMLNSALEKKPEPKALGAVVDPRQLGMGATYGGGHDLMGAVYQPGAFGYGY